MLVARVVACIASITRFASDVLTGDLVTAATPAATAATAATWIAFAAFTCTRRRVGHVDRLGVDKVLRCRRSLIGGRRGTRLTLGARATTAALTALTTFSAWRTCRLSGWRRVCRCCSFGAGLALIAAATALLRGVAAGLAPATLATATVATAVATAFFRTVSAPIAATATFTATFTALATVTALATSTALG